MSRQVDIKALVSHLVKGDGKDRCRICMGDTSEGQVFLGDTVMMDGDKPVTLAELLEVITGVEVTEDGTLPDCLCRDCYQDTVNAVRFKQLCAVSQDKWHEATDHLAQVQNLAADDKTYFILYDTKTILKDQKSRTGDITRALNKLNALIQHPQIRPLRKHSRIRAAAVPCKCLDCGKKFTSPVYLNIHLKTSLKSACIVCGGVVSKRSLRQHLADRHGVFVVECLLCSATFTKEVEYKRHCKEKHGPGRLNCSYCGCSFANERALAAHMFSHTLFHCPSCGATFENRKCYIYHQKQCNVSEDIKPELFKCDHCGVEYDKKPSLRIHIQHKHLNIQPYVCQTCGKRTSTRAHLESHEKVHKNERVTFVCNCGSTFRTDVGYKMHLRIHTGEKPYKCSTCGDRFLSASRRRDHIKRRHKTESDLQHACDKCPATFIRPWELRKHYLIVHYIVKDRIERKQETMRRFRTNC